MVTTRHAVDFAYTRPELDALFRYANEHDVEQGGRYDARAACILLWSHHWQRHGCREESALLGALYVHWAPTPRLYVIDTEEGFALEDLLQALGRWELQALGRVKHGDAPPEGSAP